MLARYVLPPEQHEQTFKIFCRADEGYCLTVRHDFVVLAPANPRDEYQHWYKDMTHSTRVNDEQGRPAFALVNRTTGLAIKHSLGQSHPVKLVPYNPDNLDESVLWTEGRDVGEGFHRIRMVNNIRLSFDAFHGDKSVDGVHDGTTVVLWEWCRGDNQRWKILPWGDEAYAIHRALASESTVRVLYGADLRYSLTARAPTNRGDDFQVCLAPNNRGDDFQVKKISNE